MLSKVQMLVEAAMPLVGEWKLGRSDTFAGSVAAAILSRSGRTYTGVCLHLNCGIGFCAEHAAVAEMVKARETEIDAIVAVSKSGVVAPCGRCRELLVQVNGANLSAEVGLPDGRVVPLRELLPETSTDC